MTPATAGRGDVAVVVAGAGARGAYEAGALSVLLPVLEARGERPTIFVGTSAGAINALLLASLAHLPADEASAALIDRWRRADRPQVMRPLLASLPQLLVRFAAEFTGIGRPRLIALLDPAPLRRTASDPQWLDWRQLHHNVASGAVRSVGVVATRRVDGRTVVFVEGGRSSVVPPPDEERGIHYARTRLNVAHMVASTAIPLAFPPVLIDQPSDLADWYSDGGLRLNVPIKPALLLGADRVVIVATHRVVRPAHDLAHPSSGAPHFSDAAAQVMRATLVDRMIEDVRKLVRINRIVARAGHAIPTDGSAARPYGFVEFAFVGPASDDAIAATAQRVYDAKYGGLRSWLPTDFTLIRRVLGTGSTSVSDLLSFLFFDRDYMGELVELGRADAKAMLARKANPWRVTHMPGTPHKNPPEVPSAYVRDGHAGRSPRQTRPLSASHSS